ncbi:maternal effect protein oskar [Lutzomyia longipalpis]|uniref:maternal effect protein oskar n=1 Tax=Lutzomyia longipalpis TaxID=7200 RepID=UPI0024836999|nr:maternal effect protein oskar [Lutzomyia longipalpis]
MHLHQKICEIKSILALYPHGATYDIISEDYAELVGEPIGWSYAEFFLIMNNLNSICYSRDFYGNIHWTSMSPKTSHIRRMVQLQKNPHRRRKTTTIGPCNFDGPPRKKPMRMKQAPPPQSEESEEIEVDSCVEDTDETFQSCQDPFNPHLYEYQMIGDDFFLALARLELGFMALPGVKIQQSGLCISGQTIRGAIEHLNRMRRGSVSKRVIINLGTVDLLHGRDVLDIKTEYRMLLSQLKEMGIHAIVTTLPPIANHSYHSTIKPNWEKLNAFLRRQRNCIDIASGMMQNGRTLFSCYQGEAKHVSGSSRPHVLWNKIGRQRILKAMKAYLIEKL